ncbi:MAG TPA: bifunctional [glutamine synthetase] adenylyltransferase/[glutamine synthetase]-adenylyl-L-tyrosine phosphorylase [Alphaproteobacteria bacterium]
MHDLYDGFGRSAWPAAADRRRAERERERWLAAASDIADPESRRFAADVMASPAGERVLDAVFGNSPYLSHCLIQDPAFAVRLLREGPDPVIRAVLRDIRAFNRPDTDTRGLMTALRQAKRRVALAVGLADIGGQWPLHQVTGALSDFADAAVDAAAAHLLREVAASGGIRLAHPDDPCRDSGLVVLGMGKLGGRELNYSSDIDLIILYDAERIATDDPDALQKTFVRLARNLVKILDERNSEGYVLRTDLRLRPDPASTPLAISIEAAELYYESLGQNWERAAMIKARPVAGDLAAGAEFLRRLTPYVWRKHLDFAAIQDIHSIKRQINAHRGGGTVALAGHNIKIGRGGIREIEFFAQTQQLIWGGRDPSLRSPGTCAALAALAAAGRVEQQIASELVDAYEFLRRVEHRLQMINDEQTHTLPADGPAMEALAVFLGYADAATFGDAMLATLRRVERHYAELFEEAPTLSGPGNLVFTGTDDDPATLETLASMGYRDAKKVAATVRGWHHGRYRAMRSVRARELLTELMPRLLRAFAGAYQPDAAFLRFDQFLGRLPAGVQLFSLFHANPALLDFVAELMGSAPRLAEALSRHPQILDGVLTPGFFETLPGRDALADDLSSALALARDFQDVLDICRRWKNERQFQVGVHLLRGRASAEVAGAALADIADVVLGALQQAVETEFARSHGRVPGGEMVVIALGKQGSREMTVTSDLDLILLYDAPPSVEVSDGDRPLHVSHYYTRLSNRFINAITALTGEGRLYDVDMRLRPSGTKGPIATSLEAFTTYHRESAWTWEHMALTRARTVCGPPDLQRRVGQVIRDVLMRERDPASLVADIANMRARMSHEHAASTPWNIKHWRGGLIDVEFIAQYLQLRHARKNPEILATNTREALEKVRQAALLPDDDAAMLIDALHLWQTLQAVLRLVHEGEFDPRAAPTEIGPLLARAIGAVDFDALQSTILARAAAVQALFDRMLPVPRDSAQARAASQ